jgi:hypothetical protein
MPDADRNDTTVAFYTGDREFVEHLKKIQKKIFHYKKLSPAIMALLRGPVEWTSEFMEKHGSDFQVMIRDNSLYESNQPHLLLPARRNKVFLICPARICHRHLGNGSGNVLYHESMNEEEPLS